MEEITDSGLDESHESDNSSSKPEYLFTEPSFGPPRRLTLDTNFCFQDLCPVVKLVRLTKKQIYRLSKGKNRAQNLREYIRSQRLNKRKENRFQKIIKVKKLQAMSEIQKKMAAIRSFVDYHRKGNELIKFVGQIEMYKRSVVDIDRFSDTLSIADSERSRKDRPQRKSAPPSLFSFDTFTQPSKRIKLDKEEPDTLESVPEIEYRVEAILDVVYQSQELWFHVKWENYPRSDNTWEPLENVRDLKVFDDFIESELKDHHESMEKYLSDIVAEEKPKYASRSKKSIMAELKTFDLAEFESFKVFYKFAVDKDGYKTFKGKFRHLVMLGYYDDLLETQKAAHEKIKNEFMEKEFQKFSIDIENNVDFSILPSFEYIRESILPKGYQKTSPSIGCECIDCSHEGGECCPSKAKKKHNFAYKVVNNTTRLRLRTKQMIVECNESCSCPPSCINRVTQRPNIYPFIIFKTSDGRGWGVKSAAAIPRGTFLMEYTGEIIDQEESLRRGTEQDERGQRYMFDLDYNENVEALYTIDAGICGNLSRLINHNCEPNCLIWPVTDSSEELSIYKLGYFTTRPIKPGEELSIDYTGANVIEDDVENLDNDMENETQGNNIAHRHQKNEVDCKCGSANCRGKMFL